MPHDKLSDNFFEYIQVNNKANFLIYYQRILLTILSKNII